MKLDYKLKVLSTLLRGAVARLGLKGRNYIEKPVILEFMITSRCDCRCIMCNIWKKNPAGDLTMDEIRMLLADPTLSDLRTITLAGGEPFKRKELLDICELINANCRNLIQLYLSTNGFDCKGIEEKVSQMLKIMKNIKRLRIAVSFDHMGEIHDKIRSRDGIHKNALELVGRLKSIDDSRLTVQGNFTIAPYNINDIWRIYEYFKNIGLKIFWFSIMTSDNFFENEEKAENYTFNKEEKIKLEEFIAFLRSNDTSMPDYYYYTGLKNSLHSGSRAFPCSGGSKFLMINSEGDVYPCYIIPKKYRMGSIREKSLSDIWNSEEAQQIRKIILNNPTCAGCIQWYDGYALSYSLKVFSRLVLAHPFRVMNHLVKK